MALYVGDAVGIQAVVRDPFTQAQLINGITVRVDFYAPERDPKNDPTVRSTPNAGPLLLTYDPAAITRDGTGAWTGFQPTPGWAPGKWSYRVTVEGAYRNVEFGTFTLKP